MLKQLYIKNFIIIEELNLEFKSGFSAFTGETGAGKSILIDAIGLLSGDRASSSLIKSGCSEAVLEGAFDFSHNRKALNVLEEAGFVKEDLTLISRTLLQDGKSQMRINHRLATAGLVREIMESEIDIHSQHDTQYLLNRASHRQLLDEYINQPDTLKDIRDTYTVWHDLYKELQDTLKTDYNPEETEFLQYEIDEIDKANLKVGEDEELESRQKFISSFEKNFNRIQTALELLQAEEGISAKLYELSKILHSPDNNEEMNGLEEKLQEQYYALEEVQEKLQDMLERMDISEEEVNAIHERLFELGRLKRKYGNSIQAVLDHRQSLIDKIERIDHRQEYIAKTQAQVDKAYAAFEKKALAYSSVRKEKAALLEQEIQKHLKDLMLPNAVFKSAVSSHSASAFGLDEVEFLISMNPGEAVKPLSKIASGGELSRLMLGLKTIFTQYQGIQTVIFDEIDTGVSGAVATAIGVKMSLLAQHAQVFSVTHLAQVAACAKNHYHVSKKQEKDHTETLVTLLDTDSRIRQLALLANGSEQEAALQAARELFSQNQEKTA